HHLAHRVSRRADGYAMEHGAIGEREDRRTAIAADRQQPCRRRGGVRIAHSGGPDVRSGNARGVVPALRPPIIAKARRRRQRAKAIQIQYAAAKPPSTYRRWPVT